MSAPLPGLARSSSQAPDPCERVAGLDAVAVGPSRGVPARRESELRVVGRVALDRISSVSGDNKYGAPGDCGISG